MKIHNYTYVRICKLKAGQLYSWICSFSFVLNQYTWKGCPTCCYKIGGLAFKWEAGFKNGQVLN